MNPSTAAKMVVAVSIAFGAIMCPLPLYEGKVQATEENAFKLNTAKEAIDRARALRLVPTEARASAKLAEQSWEVSFWGEHLSPSDQKPYLSGLITLQAKNGKVTAYSANLRSSYSIPYGSDPFDESTFKFAVNQALEIATQFVSEKAWDIPVHWMYNPYPIDDYTAGREFQSPRMHIVRFDRSHDGIRDGSINASVTVDRVTGDVRAYSVYWKEPLPYSPNSLQEATGVIGLNKAAELFYDAVDPFLRWQGINDPERPELVYSLHPQYVMTYDGKFPVEYQWKNPTIPEKINPAYSSELAKKRLLSIYDLNLEYWNGKLVYKLRLKPEIHFFREGLHPSIVAGTGGWVDFLNLPLEKPLPPAGDWLMPVAPHAKAGYAAAVVWNNELLRLEDQPYIQSEYTLLPFRELLAKLGAKIGWDPVERKVTASKDGTTIELTVDSETVVNNGAERKLEAPARIRNDRTFVPARFVLEAFGVNVGWNARSRLVLVTTSSLVPAPSPEDLKRHGFQAQLDWENNIRK